MKRVITVNYCEMVRKQKKIILQTKEVKNLASSKWILQFPDLDGDCRLTYPANVIQVRDDAIKHPVIYAHKNLHLVTRTIIPLWTVMFDSCKWSSSLTVCSNEPPETNEMEFSFRASSHTVILCKISRMNKLLWLTISVA